jgi:hypothetical protein
MQKLKIGLFILTITISVTENTTNLTPVGGPTTPKNKLGPLAKRNTKSSSNKNNIFKGVEVKQPQIKPQLDKAVGSLENAVLALQKNIESVQSTEISKLPQINKNLSSEDLTVVREIPVLVRKISSPEMKNLYQNNNVPSKINSNIPKLFSKNNQQRVVNNEKSNSDGGKKLDNGRSPSPKEESKNLKKGSNNLAGANLQSPIQNLPNQIRLVDNGVRFGLNKKNLLGNDPVNQNSGARRFGIKNQSSSDKEATSPAGSEGKLEKKTSAKNLEKKSSNGLLLNKLKNKVASLSNDSQDSASENDLVTGPVGNRAVAKVKVVESAIEESPEIAWELGLIKSYFVSQKQANAYTLLKTLITKANSIIKMYFKSTSNYPIIPIPAGLHCGVMIKKPIQTKAKLFMIVDVMSSENYDPDVIASAKSCYFDQATARTYTGVMWINPQLMVDRNSSQTEIHQYLMTIVHESLHVLAFYGDQDSMFAKPIDMQFKHLQILKDSGQEVFDGHWHEQYLPNDIMIHVDRPNSIITVHSLEVVGHKSPNYQPNFKNLPANPFLDSLESEADFFNYKCLEGDLVAKYDVFCTTKQLQSDDRHCSQDYTFKTYCDREPLKNGCFPKVAYPLGSCIDPKSASKRGAFEHVGPDGRCFSDADNSNSYCLKFIVVDDKVSIIINEQTYKCEENDQIISFNYSLGDGHLYIASVRCPNIKHFVAQYKKTNCPEECNHNGFCSNGQCLCFDGFDPDTNCKKPTHSTTTGFLFSESLQ